MRQTLKILGLLFITSVIFALGNCTEQQELFRHATEQLQSQIGDQSPFAPLSTISSRQSSTATTARRIYSSHRHCKAHFSTVTPHLSTTLFEKDFIHKPTVRPSLSLVFRLHNIRV